MSQELAVTEAPATGEALPDGVPWMLTPGEVADLFRVDPKTVTRWAKARVLTSIRTAGGHRRYLTHQVRALFLKDLTAALGDQYGPAELERAFGSALTAARATAAPAGPLALEAPRA